VKKYGAWDELPRSVKSLFERADPRYELPSREELSKVYFRKYIVMTAEYMLLGAKRKAEEMGIRSVILAQRVSAEAKDAARTLASIAREVEQRKRPFKAPFALISGGELIVTMGRNVGKDVKGGRNQEFALASATRIDGSDKITVGSVDSDGTDGPTEVAGGISDGFTVKRAKELDVDIYKALEDHNSYQALARLEDLIYTGSTGTNVQDLRVIYISD
jgi:glycerate-2-kinase